MRNLHLTFDWHYTGQKLDEDFAKFCGLLRIYELYHGIQALFRSFFVAVFLGFQLERNDVGRTAIQAKIFELFPHLK